MGQRGSTRLLVEFPQVFVHDVDEGTERSAAKLAATIADLGLHDPFVVSGSHGRELAAALGGPRIASEEDPTADQAHAASLGADARRAGADAVVAIGGGRCIDVAKLVAAGAGLPLVVVPTQLSHDGICSPVAVVPNERGVRESLGAVAPVAVILSLPVIVQAPVETVSAGLGDLLANPLALRDWALAAERGLETVDQRAWDLAVESFELIESALDCDPGTSANDPAFWRRFADALVLSGMAMIVAGSSRPASGAEHEISHAIDSLHGGRALHGAQVAFGCIVSVALYGEDVAAFRQRLRTLKLPDHPGALGLEAEDLVHVLLHAPQTRPGRFTILEDAALDEAGARSLVGSVWPSGS